ncbi:ABC transporter ATP-binding protein [Niveibacterium sp.]|uniref:ABC transporter ATP-binding protein n=1 Tax=Niveibacterium sp. TaxID=2017444 RepID=UPI0035B0330A
MASISFRGINKTYAGNVPVIRDVDLEIADGELCVFVGPSGCGKSTLLRMVAGLEDITSGDLLIDGKLVNTLPPSARGIAMVFQSYALYPHMTVARNMGFALRLAHTAKAAIDGSVDKAARILQVEHLLERKPKELSGGQRQRVAIGRAIVREPGVFLFDEPLSNLDAALRVQTRIEIARLQRKLGKASMIYVTHDQVEAMTLADKIVLLNTGEDTQRYGSIAQVGSPLELYHRPRNLFAAGFIGSPKMNLIPGMLVSATPTHAEVRIETGELLTAELDATRLRLGAKVTLGVRPEHIQPGATDMQTLNRQVMWAERLGESTFIYLEQACSADALIAKAKGDQPVPRGEMVALGIPPGACHLFDDAGQALPRPCHELAGFKLPWLNNETSRHAAPEVQMA